MLHIGLQLHMLRSFVDQRLSAVTDDICQRFAATLAEYEREVLRLNVEISRQRRLLGAAGDTQGDTPQDEAAGVLLSFTTEEELEVEGQSFPLDSVQKDGGASQPDDTLTTFSPSLDEELLSVDSQLEGVKQEVDESHTMLEALVRAEIRSDQEGVLQNVITDKVPQLREWGFTAHLKGEEDGASGREDTDTKITQLSEAKFQPTEKQLEDVGVKQDQNEDHMMMEISSQLEDNIQNFTTDAEQQARESSDSLQIKLEEGETPGPEGRDTKLTLSPDWQVKGFIEEEQPPDLNSNSVAQPELFHEFSDKALFEPVNQASPGIQTRPPADQNLLICNSCGREFSSKTTLKKHIRRYTDQDQDQDQMSCSLRRQKAPFQKPSKLFSCIICGGSFYSQGILLRHTEGHCKEPESQCGICGDHLPSTNSLIEHVQSHKELGVTCDVCGKKWSSIRRMEIHKRIHTGEKPYHCGFCSRSFSRKETLERHLKAHTGERPHSCGFCRKSFTRREYLIRHLSKVH